MALPVQSVRAAPEHRDVLQTVADLLRQGRAAELRQMLRNLPETPLGPYRSADAAIDDAVLRLVAQLDPDEIWLFGSRARGDHHPDSDIDLMVVLPDDLSRECYSLQAVRRPLLGGGAPVDAFAVSRTAFDTDPDALGGLVAEVRREGRRLYQARRLRRAAA